MDASTLKSQKLLLRKKLRQSIKQIETPRRIQKSRRIIKRLLATASFKRSRYFFTYVSTSGEVDTRPLISKALSLGKKVYVPRMLRGRHMGAFEIRSFPKDVKRSRYGILEPHRSCRKVSAIRLDFVVVPGLAFDRHGARLGRGLGYFDRFLAKTKRAVKIGLAFREQVVKKVPTDRRDVRVDRVITD